MYGFSWSTDIFGWSWQGEYTYKVDTPLQQDDVELLINPAAHPNLALHFQVQAFGHLLGFQLQLLAGFGGGGSAGGAVANGFGSAGLASEFNARTVARRCDADVSKKFGMGYLNFVRGRA